MVVRISPETAANVSALARRKALTISDNNRLKTLHPISKAATQRARARVARMHKK